MKQIEAKNKRHNVRGTKENIKQKDRVLKTDEREKERKRERENILKGCQMTQHINIWAKVCA